MDAIGTLLIAVAVILLLFLLKGKDVLPGPVGLPIIGYLPFITTKPHIKLQKLAQIYGPIYSVQLGSQKCIVLNDFETTRDAFAQDAFIGRPPTLPFDLSKETIETGAFNGLAVKEQRRFSLHLLKNLGLGSSYLEDEVKGEINDMLKQMEESDGRSTFIKTYLAASLSNNFATLLFGKKIEDSLRIRLDEIRTAGSAAAKQVAWQVFFPWLAKLAKAIGFGQKMNEMFSDAKKFARDEIKEHQANLDENNIKDYLDGYLLEIRKNRDPAFSVGVLQDAIFILFTAGIETARVTMEWFMLAMAAYPEVQKKVHNEIEAVIGSFRTPSYKDQTKMPYTQATIMELMRWRTILPISGLRYTLWDTKINDYFIPKHSYVLSNTWAIHHSTEYWGIDPESFRPERFLTDDQKDVVKSEYLIPFSTGKRSCLGESYGKMIIFLYCTSILQKFEVSLPEGATPNFEGELGLTLSPIPQKLCICKRN